VAAAAVELEEAGPDVGEQIGTLGRGSLNRSPIEWIELRCSQMLSLSMTIASRTRALQNMAGER
jgi:hypothetical protein